MAKLKTTLRSRDKRFGNTYDVVNKDTGEEFTIDEFPKGQRTKGEAKYIVEKKYGGTGSWWRKTRTLREAKEFIKKVV